MARESAPWARGSGIALGVLVLVQIGLGFLLNTAYTPTPEGAHSSVQALRDDTYRGFLQNFHYWGSAWLIVHSFLHVFLLLLSGAYLRISKLAWIASVALFGSSFLMQVTGNLLPFDRHDVQTAVIEGGIAAGIPALGDFSAKTVLQGDKFGPETLSAWHSVHFWLMIPLALAALVCLFGFGAAAKKRSAASFMWLLPIVGIAALSALFSAPFGAAATAADYGAFDARPSWYTLPMHGALNAFDSLSSGLGWIGTALLPGLLGLFLLLAPWIGKRFDWLARTVPTLIVLAYGVFAVLFGGTPAPAWGLQDVPETKAADGSLNVTAIDEAKAMKGFELAKANCACHGPELRGTAQAPNLHQMFRRQSDAAWFVKFVKNPRSMKPSSTMPALTHLSDSELATIAEWLRKPK